jgi:drug/metabolite transporter (DMT)-like permease
MTILILSYLSLTRGSAAITNTLQNLSPAVWWPAIYSGIVASFMARSLAVKSMEQTGAAVRSGLSYLETLMGITLPLLILGEQLSVEMMIGAVLILFGIYLAESSGKHHWFKMGGKYHPHHEYHHGRVR